MQSVDRRQSGEGGPGEDRSVGVDLYKKEEARAFVAVSWAWPGFHTGPVVVVVVDVDVVVMMTEASHRHREEYKWDPWTRSGLQWVCFRALATFLAVAGTRHRQNPHEGSYYLEASVNTCSRAGKNKQGQNHDPREKSGQKKEAQRIAKAKLRINLHSGFCSSHFFFLLRHVRQPVFVRLLKFRFLFLASDWMRPSLRCSGVYCPE
jgi:hypothetical protein